MSTWLFDRKWFSEVQYALYRHATTSLTRSSHSALGGNLFRDFEVDPWPGAKEKGFGNVSLATSDFSKVLTLVVRDWQIINYNAYRTRYAENEDAMKGLRCPMPPNPEATILLSIPVLLKRLQCLRYNCDNGAGSKVSVGKERAKERLETLDTVITSLTVAALDLIPEYKNAPWG